MLNRETNVRFVRDSVTGQTLDLAAAANVGNAGCDRSIEEMGRMSALGRPRRRPAYLYFNGFRDCQSIFQFNAKISNRAVHLCVSEQELNCS